MPARLLTEDEPFFREWNLHHGPMTRSRERARLLARAVGLSTSPEIPIIGVVGSKGKGSCVAAITQALVTSGYRVGTISSPPFLTNLERIRINGIPLTLEQYASLGQRLSRALEDLPPVEETGGYLAPTGAFTLMGALHALDEGVDVLVIEEGLGGATDEISQFRLDTLVVTPVFLEHEGVLGTTVDEIAANLVGAGDSRTRRVVIPSSQGSAARAQIAALLPQAEVIEVAPGEDLGFGPLTSHNIATGYEAARATCAGVGPIPHGEWAKHLRLPGRSTVTHAHGTTWFLDAAISAEGVRSALECAHAHPGFATAPVYVCEPDIKDVDAILRELPRERTTLVTTHEDHLDFHYPSGWPVERLHDALRRHEGSHALAIGTMSFAADMADYLGLDTTTWFARQEAQ